MCVYMYVRCERVSVCVAGIAIYSCCF
uniref:LD11885p n=1 Tax=Drosophila melanogaster TaxID=7227 RepID=Q8SZH9_DROME|nr:LD11885p [Drosophila melanogaster]